MPLRQDRPRRNWLSNCGRSGSRPDLASLVQCGRLFMPSRSRYERGLACFWPFANSSRGTRALISPPPARPDSVTHEALGRCAWCGHAAWISVRHATSPRGVYEKHLALLKDFMAQPGAMRCATLDVTLLARSFVGINPTTLEGIVIGDEVVELTSKWDRSGNLTGFVGENYLDSSDAKATARLPFTIVSDDTYEIRVPWQPHVNHAQAATVTVQSNEGWKMLVLDQAKPASGANGFQCSAGSNSLRTKKIGVLYRVTVARGVTHIDAVQVVPIKRSGEVDLILSSEVCRHTLFHRCQALPTPFLVLPRTARNPSLRFANLLEQFVMVCAPSGAKLF